MHDEDFELYLNYISKYEPFTKEEQIDYFKRYKNGEDVFEEIFLHNTLLVVSIAKKFFKYLDETNFTIMDLIEYGNMGLIEAIRTYNYNTSVFSTWACMIISQRITAAIRDYGKYFHINDKTKDKIKKYKYKYNKLQMELGREPTIDELAIALNLKKKQVLLLQQFVNTIDLRSLDDMLLIPSEQKNMLSIYEDYVPSMEDEVVDQICKKRFLEIIKNMNLSEKEKVVLLNRYCDNPKDIKTYEEIANNLGLSKQGVHNIEQSVLKKIRKSQYFYELASFRDDSYDVLKKNEKTNKQIELNIKL